MSRCNERGGEADTSSITASTATTITKSGPSTPDISIQAEALPTTTVRRGGQEADKGLHA